LRSRQQPPAAAVAAAPAAAASSSYSNDDDDLNVDAAAAAANNTNDNDDEDGNRASGSGGGMMEDEEEDESAYHSFRSRQAKGVLYKISAVEGVPRAKLTKYVNEGAMDADLRYVREVYGLTNTSGRKDFDLFWESPWVEEHVRDTTRKRKLDAQQRAVAVRSYIRASSTTAAEPENIDKYLDTVDRLTEWEDRHGAKDIVKTVSRFVQSFEHAAIISLQGHLSHPECRAYKSTVETVIDPTFIEFNTPEEPSIASIACTLRRSAHLFHLFASVVASEIIWAEATNGARNTAIYMCKQLDVKRGQSALSLIRSIYAMRDPLPHDTVGLPLMHINASMCVCRGILVVMPGATSATYILDLSDGTTDLTGVRNIRISQLVTDAAPPERRAKTSWQ
jgi:hypothetical protein